MGSATAAAAAAPPALQVERLGKRFDRTAAVQAVSCAVPPGQAVLLLGHNGAGKTTLLRLCATLLSPSEGRVRIGGLDAGEHGSAARRQLAVLGHESFLYPDLTAHENLTFYARLYRLADPAARVEAQIDRFALRGWAHRPVRTLSRGMLQRCALARVLLHDPRLLLLDEPFTGLDAAARELLCGELRAAHARGAAVLMSTHDVPLGASLCERALVLARGRLVADLPIAAGDADRLDVEVRRHAGTSS
ncbi:heme ABC exporter ATP-binding protein CcmA [bacterium]|nr:heme ABC exporter ATP-binding protein CcmA [bacterium]